MRRFDSLTACKTCMPFLSWMLYTKNSINKTTIVSCNRSIMHRSINSMLDSQHQNKSVTVYTTTTDVIARRHFYSLGSLAYQLIQGTAIIVAFSAFGNSYCNIRKYGQWRFFNQWNTPNLAEDFPTARYIGGLLGFLFWWFFAGGTCNQANRDLDQVPFNIRIGPL